MVHGAHRTGAPIPPDDEEHLRSMKKSTIIALLALSLSAAACSAGDENPPGSNEGGLSTDDDRVGVDSGDGEDSDMATESGDMDMATESGDMAAMSDPVCEEFFGGRVPLADRADMNRDMIAAGEIVDPATYGEVNLLKQRMDGLLEESSAEQATVLESINAPFAEASEAVQTGGAQDEETGEVTLPEIDVEASAAAQDEFEASCQG